MVAISFQKVQFQSSSYVSRWRSLSILGALAGGVELIAEDVAILRLLDKRAPVVREARRQSRRAFRVHLRGARAGEQIALAGRVVGCLRYRGDIALVRAIALFERQPRIVVGEALRLGLCEGHHATDVVAHLPGMERPA